MRSALGRLFGAEAIEMRGSLMAHLQVQRNVRIYQTPFMPAEPQDRPAQGQLACRSECCFVTCPDSFFPAAEGGWHGLLAGGFETRGFICDQAIPTLATAPFLNSRARVPGPPPRGSTHCASWDTPLRGIPLLYARAEPLTALAGCTAHTSVSELGIHLSRVPARS